MDHPCTINVFIIVICCHNPITDLLQSSLAIGSLDSSINSLCIGERRLGWHDVGAFQYWRLIVFLTLFQVGTLAFLDWVQLGNYSCLMGSGSGKMSI